MGDIFPKFKAAAIQAAPVFLNREASIDKACNLIENAAQNGAEIIALPEVFIPGGPYWAWHMNMNDGMKFSLELFQNSVEVPSKSTDTIGKMAKKYGVYIVIGINERENKSLYNTLLFFDRNGNILGKHRKFKPTGSEKLVWGDGDGSTHQVYETDIGKIGGLICGEHTMALPGYTLSAMGEQVHIASWVGFANTNFSLSEICSRYHAIAFNTHVICSQSVVDQSVIDKLGIQTLTLGKAWSAIIEAGTGRILAGPIPPDEEGIVYAEIDLNQAAYHYFKMDSTGHSSPKQFQVYFDAREIKPVTINKNDSTPKSPLGKPNVQLEYFPNYDEGGKYAFPAIFEPYKNSIGITFPDLPGCTSQSRNGEEPTYEHALEIAKEALALHLIAMDDDGDQIPEPTPLNQLEIPTGEAVVIVEVALPLYRQRFDNDFVRTNVTLPKWLKEYAQSNGVNLSKVLTDGLYSTLGLKKHP